MNLGDYTWLIVVGSFGAFLFGFGTGSNDVANAFGTSVGAKTLTLKQAVFIATIFEFVGAMVLSRVSTNVIAGGIADIKAFQHQPIFYAYGMVCSLVVAGIWQIVSSYLSFNTSSTHSIIGCIIGFALVFGGPSAVNWYTEDPTAFPPAKGVTPIIVSWFFSPIFCAIASACLFSILKYSILRRRWGFNASFYIFPFLVLVTFFLSLYFVFTKGAKKSFQNSDQEWTDAKSAWVAACAAAGCALISGCAMPWVFHLAHVKFESDEKAREEREAAEAKLVKGDVEGAREGVVPSPLNTGDVADAGKVDGGKTTSGRQTSETSNSSNPSSMKSRAIANFWNISGYITHGVDVDIHECIEDDPIVAKIHAHAEKFPPKVEFVFSYLQVFSACCVIFAHGAGEVGYMSGPLGAIVDIVDTGAIHKSVEPYLWVIGLCASALVIGLATYGYNVVRLAKLSPSRGFCAELSTAFVIMLTSQYGLPTSSSQVITGGIVGIGLCEGVLGVNWNFFALQFASWVGTIFVCGGLIQRLGPMDLLRMRAQLNSLLASETLELGVKVQTPNPVTLIVNLLASLAFLQNGTVLTIGQDLIYPYGPQLCYNGSQFNTMCVSPALV